MNLQLPARIKQATLSTLSAVSRRHAILLPEESRDESKILHVTAPYRVDGPTLDIELHEQGRGRLSVEILAYAGNFPNLPIWKGIDYVYRAPCHVTVNLPDGAVRVNSELWGSIPTPLPGRRFCCRWTFSGADGVVRRRTTGHYLSALRATIDETYFKGDDYVDYEAQSQNEHLLVLALARQFGATGPVLEVGCATGGVVAAFDAIGVTSVGIDKSRWAVEEAARRLGPGRVWECDLEQEDLPETVREHAPFGTLVLWAVLEHFREPFSILEKLSNVARNGTRLLINTTNAGSLTHSLFGSNWEGYFDSTHFGVDKVGVQSLRRWLASLGWRIDYLKTELVWDGDADPTRATLREWWNADARFRQLIGEQELGDLIRCVAVKV